MSQLQNTAEIMMDQLLGKQLYLDGGRFDAGLTIVKGQALALVTATAVNQTVTFTATSASAGEAVCAWAGKRFTVAYNDTAATMTAKLNNVLGAGNFAVTGGALPGTPLTVTLQGVYAAMTVALPTVISTTIVGGTLVFAVGTAAVPNGRMVAYDDSKIANPTTGLSASAAGTGATLGVGDHAVTYTWANANGETLPAPPVTVTLTSAQNVRVAAINAAGTPDDATILNVYIDGQLAKAIAVTTPGSGGNVVQTDIAAFDTTINSKSLPEVNTALKKTTGAQTFFGFANGPISTDSRGNVIASSQAVPGIVGHVNSESSVVRGGILKQTALSGISDWTELLRQTGGRVMSGTIAGGTALLHIPPLGHSRV